MAWRWSVSGVVGALALSLVVPLGAWAEESGNGWYASGNVGAAFTGAWDHESTVTTFVPSGSDALGEEQTSLEKGELETDTGFGLGAAVGYGWRNVRIEGELSWLRLGVDSFDVGGVDGSDEDTVVEWGGRTSILGLMANGYYDIDTGTKWVPYIGGGLGAARAKLKLTVSSRDVLDPATVETGGGDDARWVLAYQIGAGVAYPVSESVMVQLGYRFFGTSEAEFEWQDEGKTKASLYANKIEIGVRYRF